jgi:CRP-like cAMP-binding protein
MLGTDFFGFCTTLKPLELKAIGQLSQVRHLAEGEVIYSPGDSGDALYIINRGVVEVVQGHTNAATAETYLSRGDIFGDVEVLTNLPRKNLVRTREPVSLQCFPAEHFSELVRRVPSFFHYLSERIAFRLAQARDLMLAQSHCLELRGSLSNFDLVTIYQTIVNSMKTGELCISNESSKLLSAFYFDNGRPRRCQFEHLTGEEAFSQLFLSEALPGTFSFTSSDEPVSAWAHAEGIAGNPEEMLINALRGRDELAELRHRLCDGAAMLRRQKPNLALHSSVGDDLRPVAEQIWNVIGDEPTAIASLFGQCSFSELKIYAAVDELIESQHLDLSPIKPSQKVACSLS